MAGGWLPLVLRPTHIRLQTYLSFASGVMLGAAVCHMLPEAARLAPNLWPSLALGGLLVLFFLERFLAFHQHEIGDDAHGHTHAAEAASPSVAHARSPVGVHEHGPEAQRAAGGRPRLYWPTALVGLSIHTLIGGFALASAVVVDADGAGWVGLSVFLATALHKPADSLTITSLMISEGTERRTAHLVNLVFALVIPLGVLLYFAAEKLVSISQSRYSGAALGFSAGTFLTIALSDLMPELQFHQHDRVKLSLALLAGVAVMFASALLGG